MNRETRDWRGRLVELVVDITYRDADRETHAPSGLFQIVSDGNRLTFPDGGRRDHG